MFKKIIVTGAFLSFALLTGCASIVSGQNQSVSVDTPGCSAAKCQLTNAKGSWFVTTPGSVTIRRAYGNMAVNCAKDGYTPVSSSVASSTKGMAFGNILLGGVIGAGVDIGTGAAYDYPTVISLPLACGTDAAVAATTGSIPSTPQVKPIPLAQSESSK